VVLARPCPPRLVAAQTISRWGDTFNTVALVVLVFRLTGSGLGVTGAVIAEIAPVLLLAPAGRRGHRPAAAGAGADCGRPVAHGPGRAAAPGRPAPARGVRGGVRAGRRRRVVQPGHQLAAAQRGRRRADRGQLPPVLGRGHLPDRTGTAGWRPGGRGRGSAGVPGQRRGSAGVPGQRGQLPRLRAAGRAAPARQPTATAAGSCWPGLERGRGCWFGIGCCGCWRWCSCWPPCRRATSALLVVLAGRQLASGRAGSGCCWPPSGRRGVRSAAAGPAGQQPTPAGAGVRAAAAAWPGRPGLGQRPLARTSNLELSGRELDRPSRQPGPRRGWPPVPGRVRPGGPRRSCCSRPPTLKRSRSSPRSRGTRQRRGSRIRILAVPPDEISRSIGGCSPARRS
jgi:hypothetical protein